MSDLPIEAAIFDLDGVITKTAAVHSAAWKQMFDEFLRDQAQETGGSFREFDHEDDYLPYVDGKPRLKGVADFLQSRGIEIPSGEPSDPPTAKTIHGLGKRKNQLFNEIIERDGVEVYRSSLDLIRELRGHEVRVGVATSSKNCQKILQIAGIQDLFAAAIGGVISAELGLDGKPAADIFTTAADRLGAAYDRTMIVEDAVSGVQAGRAGNFGLVVGVARESNGASLRSNGADIVVEDVGEISLNDLRAWYETGLPQDSWSLSYWDYEPEKEGTREALCTVGNGYFGTRGAFEESRANEINYPGTYIAGLYNRLESRVAGKTIVNEDFVNCPNWLPITFRIADRDWIDLNQVEILEISRRLDFRTGVLYRELVFRDEAGCETRIESQRLASMANHHLAAIRYAVTPLNYFGPITFCASLDGTVINDGVPRYRSLSSKHLEPVHEQAAGSRSSLTVRTTQSHVTIAQSADLQIRIDGADRQVEVEGTESSGRADSTFSLNLEKGQCVQIEKRVAIFTSKDEGVDDPLTAAQELLEGAGSFAQILAETIDAWRSLWDRFDVQVEGDRLAQKLIRFNTYHTLITASPHNEHIDAGIPARGLTGEAYRGHIFWDEIYILPLYNMHLPETARSVLMYRYRRLDAAREYARKHGYEGAMFPWQSGSSGREETQVIHLNPLSGEWGPDYSRNQRHVGLAIAYNIWCYYWVSGDLEFLERYGAEMFMEICRFFAGLCEWNAGNGRYEISGVMGPDEYHEKYPSADQGGLKDNSYTNIMLAWALDVVPRIEAAIGPEVVEELRDQLGLAEEERERWADIRRKLNISISADGVLEQFDGFFDLEELDWDSYREEYGNISRMDRILKAEGKSPDAFQVTKQADALMPFYNLDPDRVMGILKEAGYAFGPEDLRATYNYYIQRTSHGSTLSRLVYAHLAHLIGKHEQSLALYQEALRSDYDDIQGKTTAEGTHIGVMAGSVHLAMKSYGGLSLQGEHIRLDPELPATWRRLRFQVGFRGYRFNVDLGSKALRVSRIPDKGGDMTMIITGRTVSLPEGEAYDLKLADGDD